MLGVPALQRLEAQPGLTLRNSLAGVGVDAVNFGPGAPRFAHRRDEQVEVAALVESYTILERFLCG